MIKALILDVDGVLTDGGIIYNADGVETKRFDVKDGLGIKLAQKAGIEVIVISGRASKVTEIRCAELGIKRCYTGVRDKVDCFNAVKAELNLKNEETACMGDDINDLKLLRSVGLSSAPADAFEYIRSEVGYVTTRQGGHGAVREFIEHILVKNDLWQNILNTYS